jgi:hypothetical protein
MRRWFSHGRVGRLQLTSCRSCSYHYWEGELSAHPFWQESWVDVQPILHLWTAPPWQEGPDPGLTWSIANIYPASPDDGAPKWGIRSHPPRQVVDLEGHYRSQGLGVPVRPVSPFSDPSRNLVHRFMQRRGTGLHFEARPRLPAHSCWRLQPWLGYARAVAEVRLPSCFAHPFYASLF